MPDFFFGILNFATKRESADRRLCLRRRTVVGACEGEVTVARACVNEEQSRAKACICIASIRGSRGREKNMGGAALHLTQHAQRSSWMDGRAETNGIVVRQRFPAFTPRPGSRAAAAALRACSPAGTHPHAVW